MEKVWIVVRADMGDLTSSIDSVHRTLSSAVAQQEKLQRIEEDNDYPLIVYVIREHVVV